MQVFNVILIAMALAVISYGFCHLLIYFSHKHNILDEANSRSSHKQATPRIGGIAFAALMCLGLMYTFLFDMHQLPISYVIALCAAPFLVAIVSLIDDIKNGIARWLRLIFHIITSSLVIYLFNPPLNTLNELLIIAVLFVGLVWFINLYNFMDGIDGLAASEAIFILSVSAIFSFLTDHISWFYIHIMLAGPIVGFLFINWQPAKIFMGDVGSTFLGALIPILLLIDIQLGILNPWAAIILLGTFLVDSTWTLTFRFITGQRWYHPHRSHLYQILSRKTNSHAKVSGGNAALNLIWLTPLSIGANQYPNYGHFFTIIALLPLLTLCIMMKAGHKLSN